MLMHAFVGVREVTQAIRVSPVTTKMVVSVPVMMVPWLSLHLMIAWESEVQIEDWMNDD